LKKRLRLLAYQEYVDSTEVKFVVKRKGGKAIIRRMDSGIKLIKNLRSVSHSTGEVSRSQPPRHRNMSSSAGSTGSSLPGNMAECFLLAAIPF